MERAPVPFELHVLGPTLMPRPLMARAYAPVVARLGAGAAAVEFHAMPERGGLGRTDAVVDSLRPLLEAAAGRGARVRLAGHSLGGIVSWALAHDHPDVVESIELWCSPVRGTALCRVGFPLAEVRFLARNSRWIVSYDRPLLQVPARAIFPALDVLATPALEVCPIRGDHVENHVVSPVPLRQARQRGWFEHIGRGGHVSLPRRAWLNQRLAHHDLGRQTSS